MCLLICFLVVFLLWELHFSYHFISSPDRALTEGWCFVVVLQKAVWPYSGYMEFGRYVHWDDRGRATISEWKSSSGMCFCQHDCFCHCKHSCGYSLKNPYSSSFTEEMYSLTNLHCLVVRVEVHHTYLLTYAPCSQWSIDHQQPLAIALCFGLLWSFQQGTSWSGMNRCSS